MSFYHIPSHVCMYGSESWFDNHYQPRNSETRVVWGEACRALAMMTGLKDFTLGFHGIIHGPHLREFHWCEIFYPLIEVNANIGNEWVVEVDRRRWMNLTGVKGLDEWIKENGLSCRVVDRKRV
jgi:hypothetical protein